MTTEPWARPFTKGEVLATAGDWILLPGPDGEHQFASRTVDADPADCPSATLLARADGDGITPMARDLLIDLGAAGNHIIALCVIEDYFAKARAGDRT